jgi:hypothetical protein
MHQIIIFSTPEAQVTINGAGVPYVNATITLTPNEASTQIEVGLFTHLANKPVIANVTSTFQEVVVNPETEPDIIDASCCDGMILILFKAGFEIVVVGFEEEPKKISK